MFFCIRISGFLRYRCACFSPIINTKNPHPPALLPKKKGAGVKTCYKFLTDKKQIKKLNTSSPLCLLSRKERRRRKKKRGKKNILRYFSLSFSFGEKD
jgi:hypothetical protein